MSGSELVLAAVVSGVVAAVTAIVTTMVTVRQQRLEQTLAEQALQREMTTLLYAKRLEHYPKAIALTEPLRGSRIRVTESQPEYFLTAMEAIDDWHAGEAGFILSNQSLDQLYELRESLRDEPREGRFSSAQIDRVMEAKKRFRASLRHDMQLLFGEEAATRPPLRRVDA